MKLSKRLEGEFSAAIRQQGQTYHWQHLIRIREGDSRRVEAEVTGAERYGVRLDWDAPFLTVLCDCSHFEEEGTCKHLWATILAAEGQGYLSEAAVSPELFLDNGIAGYEEIPFEGEEPPPKQGRLRRARVTLSLLLGNRS